MNLLLVMIGTGGHIIPLLPLDSAFRKLGMKVWRVSRGVGVEKLLIPEPDLRVLLIPFSGRSPIEKVRSLVLILLAGMKLGRFMKTKRISGVIASGSYGSLPAILAALWLRIPYFLIELNRIPGRVVRLFAARARAVFTTLPLARRIRGTVIVTGVPLRNGFRQLQRRGEYLLILGGSQGARFLNRLALYLEERIEERIVVIAGTRDYEWLSQTAKRLEVIRFTNRPWDYLRGAKLVIGRAGGLSTYELAYCRVPMILIPYPYATDDHQRVNAEYWMKKGAAIVVEEGPVGEVGDRIIEIIKAKRYEALRTDPPPPDGRERIVREVIRLCSAR